MEDLGRQMKVELQKEGVIAMLPDTNSLILSSFTWHNVLFTGIFIERLQSQSFFFFELLLRKKLIRDIVQLAHLDNFKNSGLV